MINCRCHGDATEARREQRPEERECVARACCRPRRLFNPPQVDHRTGVIDVDARQSERKVTIPDTCFTLHAAHPVGSIYKTVTEGWSD